MSRKGNASKAVFIFALFSVVWLPLGSFGGQRIYALSEGLPFSVLGWWHQYGLDALVGSVIATMISSIIAWRMQKSGM